MLSYDSWMELLRHAALLSAITLSAAGCGSSVEGGAGGSGGAGTSSTSSSSTSSSSTSEGCPSEAPPDGAACDMPGLLCEVEDGIVVVCRATATCTAQGWENEAPGCSSIPPTDPSCPTAQPSGDCAVASDPALCVYGDTMCGCSDCLGGPCGGQAQWVCAPPPAPPCPTVAPKLGGACTDEGLSCAYGSCAIDQVLAGRACTDGAWVSDPVACPL